MTLESMNHNTPLAAPLSPRATPRRPAPPRTLARPHPHTLASAAWPGPWAALGLVSVGLKSSQSSRRAGAGAGAGRGAWGAREHVLLPPS
ncbi:hypothetical protein E2C01_083401 [Portunus trituberculatus]|uniref:Uncharacterized protein n=1 Tax=Portunus trituberculatus TaxID=210409 RepID=A0A5B7J143_PORTR|nr:hypothetical protein [Portunus trituberculatus]